MNEHLQERITIQDLSKNSAVSPSKFESLFQNITGESPITYLNHLRGNKAKVLLQSGHYSMTEIVQRCGYQSSVYFSSCFQKEYHMTPTEYAKKMNRVEY